MDISKKPPHMFSSNIVDYFFRWRWWAAWLAFLPVAAILGGFALTTASSQTTVLITFCLGILLWTLFEYLMHRFFFHLISSLPKMAHFHYVVHGMHHAHPSDPVRVIFPPFASAFIGIFVGILLYLILPIAVAASTLAGFIVGYVIYEFMHYAAHHIKWKHGWFYRRKRHHLLHHHNHDFSEKNFGVTTSLWDHVFKTN